MDPTAAIDKLSTGDGLAILSVVVVALALTAAKLYRSLMQSHDNRNEDLKIMGQENRELLTQTNTALSALSEVVREAIRGQK